MVKSTTDEGCENMQYVKESNGQDHNQPPLHVVAKSFYMRLLVEGPSVMMELDRQRVLIVVWWLPK